MIRANWMGSICLPRTHRSPLLVSLFDRLGLWLERSRQRQQLARLDERMLRDIGLDRATAAAEVDKPFWVE